MADELVDAYADHIFNRVVPTPKNEEVVRSMLRMVIGGVITDERNRCLGHLHDKRFSVGFGTAADHALRDVVESIRGGK